MADCGHSINGWVILHRQNSPLQCTCYEKLTRLLGNEFMGLRTHRCEKTKCRGQRGMALPGNQAGDFITSVKVMLLGKRPEFFDLVL